MRSFCWLILAGCLGAWGLAAAPCAVGPPAEATPAPGIRGEQGGGRCLVGRPRTPGGPEQAQEFSWEAVACDPETTEDVEAQLVARGGSHATRSGRLDWPPRASTGTTRTDPGPPGRFRPPLVVPIRC